ncbi:MAG: TonB-dependent receptor [Mangrovibacterium sp.]
MKKKGFVCSRYREKCKQLCRIMKLTVLIFLGFVLGVSGSTYSQSTRLTLDHRNITIKELLNQIEEKSDFVFLYKIAELDENRKVSLSLTNASIQEILNVVLKDQNLTYDIYDRQVIIRKADIEVPTGITQQSIKVAGKVIDSSGIPLPGVTIVVQGKESQGTITDTQGSYQLNNVPGNAVLVFTFVGMRAEEVNVNGQSTINVILEEETIGIEEVVAVGYGSILKSDLTGSVSKIVVEDVAQRAVNSVEQLLQGQVSGVQITSNTGAPGGGMTFSIRGSTSISGSNQPLIVIDGYPVGADNEGVKMSAGSQSGYLDQLPDDNVLSTLNPNDIESVEILKDASATAIYGSRASNGVVLITTKRGKSGSDRIEYNFRTDISMIPKKIDVLNTADYLAYSNEAYLNSGQDSAYTAANIAEYLKINTNWQDLVFRTAYSQNHQLNLSGGNNDMKYAVSLGYLGQEGVIKNSKYDRGSVRINLDRSINKKLKFGISMSAIMSNNKAAMQSSNIADASMSVVRGALTSRPLDSPYTAEDEIDQTQMGNPLTLINLADDQNRITNVLGNMFVEYTLSKGLTFKVNGGANNLTSHRDFYHPRGTILGNLEGGYAYRGHNSSFNYLTEYTLNFNKVIREKHRVNAVGGYTWQEWTRRSFGINALNFPNDNLLYYNLSSATSITNPRSSTQKWALSSFIARLNYSFDSRYLFTFTGRADGSTRLAEGNKWDFFPSFALGWNIHNEPFMKNIGIISTLKVKASYGLSGNQAIAVGATKAMLNTTGSVVNQSIQIGYVQANMANSTLHWETTKQFNSGIELGLWGGRITFGFEYYKKTTEDLLIALTIPPSNGFTSYNTNQGSVENRGYEFDLSGKILTGKLKWDLSGNISFNRNKIVDLGGVESFVGSSFNAVGQQSLHIAKIGLPIGSFYGYRINGIYQNEAEVEAGPTDASSANAPGSFKFVDISGPEGVPDGQITANDREIIGNPYPDFIFGINNAFDFKNVSLSFLIQGSIGQDVINANRYNLDALARGNSSNVRQEAYDNRWTGEGTSNKYPRATTSASPFSNRFTDFIVEDASYIRLKSVSLSYNIPIKRQLLIRNLRLFVTGTNLITLTDYKGFDPEINSKGDKSMMPGIDNGSIPQYKTYSFGINVSF